MKIKLVNERKTLRTGQRKSTQLMLTIIVIIINLKYSPLPRQLIGTNRAGGRSRELVCMRARKPETSLQSHPGRDHSSDDGIADIQVSHYSDHTIRLFCKEYVNVI